ncbi:MAG: hypothetical protein WC869_05770 [Phycisphaerae bacterium]|jgi:hypothetical protein
MSPLWIRVLLLQTLICVVMVPIGRLFLGLRWRSACLAVVLTLPVPLFKVSPGTAGLVFSADLVALVFLLMWAAGSLKWRLDCGRPPGFLTMMASAILVFLPIFSTLMGYLFYSDVPREIKFIALNTMRLIGYLIVFRSMMMKMQLEQHPDRFVILQCLTFVAVAACGLIQYVFKVNLDLWYEIQGTDTSAVGFGGGFMGLYRGTVGAYSIGILAALTMLMPRVRLGLLLASVSTIVIFGGMLAVGTRQGVVIGVFALCLSLSLSVSSLPPGHRVGTFFKSLGLVLLMGTLTAVLASVALPSAFREWVSMRFTGLETVGSVVDLAKSRDVTGMSAAFQNLVSHPMMMFFGMGEGTEWRTGSVFVVQVDSEFFNVWQIGGFPLLMAYFIFLVALMVKLRHYRSLTDPANRVCVAAAFAVLASSIPLLYGHFFLLNPNAANTPVGYWDWALFGGALGILTKPEYIEVSEAEYAMYAASAG